jgi:hydroxymethylglutaryl-CoA lyase
MHETVQINEVGLRDGLQSLSLQLDLECKLEMANTLSNLGFACLELGAFVNPRRVPAMADSQQLCRRVEKNESTRLRAFTPNIRGIEAAAETGIHCVGAAVALSDTFNERNIGRSSAEALAELGTLKAAADSCGLSFMLCIATILHCPFEGAMSPEKAYICLSELLSLDCELVLGETIGKATPEETSTLLDYLQQKGISVEHLGAHFHNTHGHGLANYKICLDAGMRSFDTSFGGLGGCPFAPGAAGNVATEDFIRLLDQHDYKHDIDAAALTTASKAFCEQQQLTYQAGS